MPRGVLTEKSRTILEARYLHTDDNGQRESIDGLFRRVSGGNEDYEHLMRSFDFLPNSPTLFNAHTGKKGTLSACFKFDVADSMLEGEDSIVATRAKAAAVAKWGGGVGYYFGNLRAKGSLIQTVHRKACGPVAVMRDYHQLKNLITQGGKRDLAQMGILPVWHEDIREFIHCKDDDPKALSSFNISVSWPDDWMAQVAATSPGKALDLWNEQIDSAWRTGDPGVYFFDVAERANPTPHLGKLTGTNPCVTGDTWVMTADGPVRVEDIVGREFRAVVDGEAFRSTSVGFFPTGTKSIFEVQTSHGYSVKATADHRLLAVSRRTRYVTETAWKRVDELRVGDELVIANHRGVAWGGVGTFEQGWLVGNLLGDGTFTESRAKLSYWGAGRLAMRDHAASSLRAACKVRSDIGSGAPDCWSSRNEGKLSVTSAALAGMAREYGVGEDKRLKSVVEKTSAQFHRGFLRGWFDADGSVQGGRVKGVSVRLASSDLDNLKVAQRMLGRLGVISRLHANRRDAGVRSLPDGLGGTRLYDCRADHELIVSGDNLAVFDREVGFTDPAKAAALKRQLSGYARRMNAERFVTKVVSVDASGESPVFDCTIPGPHEYDSGLLRSHNCGEVCLLNNEPCNLGSINLGNFVTANRTVDFTRLYDVARLATRFLDDILDWNYFPVQSIEDAARLTRKLGLGVMGWADILCLMHIHYDSEDAVRLADRVMKTINDAAYEESLALAATKGPYPGYDENNASTPPVRNATRTCIAPTGTIYLIAGADGSGIEPHYLLESERKTFEGIIILEKVGVVEESGGFVPHVANAIDWRWHVRHQATFQKYTDLAVSKSINMPNSATRQDVSDAYLLMWQMGAKGGTIYRDGCRSDQVLVKPGEHRQGAGFDTHTGAVAPSLSLTLPPTPPVAPAASMRRKLPCDRNSITHKFQIGDFEGYLTVGMYDDGSPGEIFIKASKEGSTVSGLLDAWAIAVSLALQYGCPVDTLTRLYFGTVFEPRGITRNKDIPICTSVADYAFRWLSNRYVKVVAGKPAAVPVASGGMSGMFCPECHAEAIYQAGCYECGRQCGWSKCG